MNIDAGTAVNLMVVVGLLGATYTFGQWVGRVNLVLNELSKITADHDKRLKALEEGWRNRDVELS